MAFPWSNAFMSVATGLLALTALLKWKGFRDRTGVGSAGRGLRAAGLALLGLVAWSAASFLWGGGGAAVLHDVRVKLPLVVGALAMMAMAGDGRRMEEGRVGLVLRLAAFSAMAATLTLVLLDLADGGALGGRQASRFISHIRFGLWWALLLPWVCVHLPWRWRWLSVFSALLGATWTQSLTGLVAAMALAPWWWPALRAGAWPTARAVRRVGLGLALMVPPVVALIFWALPTALPEGDMLPERSRGGEVYVHKLDRSLTENGHHVWTRVAWGELRRGWTRRSDVGFETIQGALVRYLTSRNLPKDEEGLAALEPGEIAAIASGMTSVVELRGTGWQKRWNRFKYNWGEWWDGRRSPDASILSRVVFLEVGFEAWLSMPPVRWAVGCGVGGVSAAMEDSYGRHFPDWPEGGHKRPHNQYLTLLLSLGALGLGLLVWTLVPMWGHAPARPGILLLALSCLTEDTLETQAGVTLAFVALAFAAFMPERAKD